MVNRTTIGTMTVPTFIFRTGLTRLTKVAAILIISTCGLRLNDLQCMGSQILSVLLAKKNYLFYITFSTSRAYGRRKEDELAEQ